MRSIFACKKIPHRKFIFKCHPIFALKTEIRIISLSSSGYKKKYYISRNTNDVFSYLVVESIGSSTAAISFSTGTITSILSLTFTEFMNILHSVHSFFDILESDSKKSRYVLPIWKSDRPVILYCLPILLYEFYFYFLQILWKSRCQILVTLPSHLKKLRSLY